MWIIIILNQKHEFKYEILAHQIFPKLKTLIHELTFCKNNFYFWWLLDQNYFLHKLACVSRSSIWEKSDTPIFHIWRCPSQDVPCFYTPSHFSDLKNLSQLYQPIYLAFSYLNSERDFQALNFVVSNFILFFTVPEKINLKFFRYGFFCFFQ